jgi:hypothetical protein
MEQKACPLFVRRLGRTQVSRRGVHFARGGRFARAGKRPGRDPPGPVPGARIAAQITATGIGLGTIFKKTSGPAVPRLVPAEVEGASNPGREVK